METNTSGVEWLKKMRQWFCISVSILLCLSAAAKIISIAQHRRFLNVPDGVFTNLTTRDMFIMAIILETLTAVFIFIKQKHLSALVVCCWLVSTFVAYRMLRVIFYAYTPCHCLGDVLDWTGLSDKALDEVPKVLLWYFGVGSLAFLFLSSTFERRTLLNLSDSSQGETG